MCAIQRLVTILKTHSKFLSLWHKTTRFFSGLQERKPNGYGTMMLLYNRPDSSSVVNTRRRADGWFNKKATWDFGPGIRKITFLSNMLCVNVFVSLADGETGGWGVSSLWPWSRSSSSLFIWVRWCWWWLWVSFLLLKTQSWLLKLSSNEEWKRTNKKIVSSLCCFYNCNNWL